MSKEDDENQLEPSFPHQLQRKHQKKDDKVNFEISDVIKVWQEKLLNSEAKILMVTVQRKMR